MHIFPAIDVINGKVVRLYQGDYGRITQYGDDPAAFAEGFAAAGAAFLHLVDLDGAKAGTPKNLAVLESVRQRAPGLFIEVGGGIRDERSVEACLAAGAGRVILGTAALKNTGFAEEMVRRYGPGAVAVGVDARNGMVATEGWLELSGTDSVDFCRRMREGGVEYIIYTDIARDGAMQGANLEIYRQLAQIDGVNFTASGGVSTLADVRALAGMGLYGAILGKALYSGAISLAAALGAAGEDGKSQ